MHGAPRLQLLSLAAGALLAASILFGLGHMRSGIGPEQFSVLRHPRDYVEIKDGTPYVVPPKRRFILIGFTSSEVHSLVEVYVDGEPVGSAGIVAPYILSAPTLLVVRSGSTIEVHSDPNGRVIGYLAGS